MTSRSDIEAAVQELHQAAASAGLTVADLGNGHYQLHGGQFLVNYWPTSRRRTAYTERTTKGRHHVRPTEAVAMAFEVPPIMPGAGVANRRKISGRTKRRMFAKQRNCHWCKAPMQIRYPDRGNFATIEHVIPLARGGLENASNRVLACKGCNSARGHDMPEVSQ